MVSVVTPHIAHTFSAPCVSSNIAAQGTVEIMAAINPSPTHFTLARFTTEGQNTCNAIESNNAATNVAT